MADITEEQLKNALAMYLALLDRFNPELAETKKLLELFLPYIDYGEIAINFYIKEGKVYKVDAVPKKSIIINNKKI